MSISRLLKIIAGVESISYDSFRVEGLGGNAKIIITARIPSRKKSRCSRCHHKAAYYDRPYEKRRWRALDLATSKLFIEAAVRRVHCPLCGVVTEHVPWARPSSRFTKNFEERVAWLTTHNSKESVSKLMRIAWSTVGDICFRVYDALCEGRPSPLNGLRYLGIDETSYKKGHKYMTVVVNHETASVVWCQKGHGKEVLSRFFEQLTPEQRASIELVSADGARWIHDCVASYCPNAKRCVDPFHVVSWATEALDAARRDLWQSWRGAMAKKEKRGRGRPRKDEFIDTSEKDAVNAIKQARFALLKNPENLTQNQQIKLQMIEAEHPYLHKAYALKERLRLIFKMAPEKAKAAIKLWYKLAKRSRIPAFIELADKIKRHRPQILNSIRNRLSNARIEAINNKIKLTIRMAYGFRNMENLIALVMLRCSNVKIELPW